MGGREGHMTTGRGLWGGVTEGGSHGVRPREGSVGPGPLQGREGVGVAEGVLSNGREARQHRGSRGSLCAVLPL